MSRFASILIMFLAFLLGTVGSASGAYSYAFPEMHSGDFLLWETEASAQWPLELADPTREIGVWVYDEALGVPVYVRQNPWTKFDPLGLQEGMGTATQNLRHTINRQVGTKFGEQLHQADKNAATKASVITYSVAGGTVGLMRGGLMIGGALRSGGLRATNAVITNPGTATMLGADAVITTAEMVAGIEGPGAIPNLGDGVRVPAQAMMKAANGTSDAASALGKTGRNVFEDAQGLADEITAFNRTTDGGGVLMEGATPMSALQSASYHSDPAVQAAALMESIAGGHMFVNGNKRTSVEAYKSFAERAGLEVTKTDSQLMDVAGKIAKEEDRLEGASNIAKEISGE